jgi:hypothetical protein
MASWTETRRERSAGDCSRWPNAEPFFHRHFFLSGLDIPPTGKLWVILEVDVGWKTTAVGPFESSTFSGWWFQPTPLKNDGVSSSVGMLFHSQLNGKITHVPNHHLCPIFVLRTVRVTRWRPAFRQSDRWDVNRGKSLVLLGQGERLDSFRSTSYSFWAMLEEPLVDHPQSGGVPWKGKAARM